MKILMEMGHGDEILAYTRRDYGMIIGVGYIVLRLRSGQV